jgi:putative iron-only hydrogenase system regulator
MRYPTAAGENGRGRIFLFIRSICMERRLGFIGIIVEDRKKSSAAVNELLSAAGDIIIARTGIPYPKRRCCVITLVVDATTDEVGTLTGKLGQVAGVIVKSALAKM